MSFEIKTEVAGIKEAVKILGKIDKAARRELTKEFKRITQPMVDDAKQRVPMTPPLSGMSRTWISKKSGVQLLPWDGTIAVRMIKPKINTRRPREYNGITYDLAAFTVMWSGGINTVYDMTGRRKTNLLSQNLTEKVGPPSRVMWPAAETTLPAVEGEMSDLINDLMRKTSAQLARS